MLQRLLPRWNKIVTKRFTFFARLEPICKGLAEQDSETQVWTMGSNDRTISVAHAHSKIESNKVQLKHMLKEKAKHTMPTIVPLALSSAIMADLSEPNSHSLKHTKTQGNNE
jgi:hypothetical protein